MAEPSRLAASTIGLGDMTTQPDSDVAQTEAKRILIMAATGSTMNEIHHIRRCSPARALLP
jgi:hypothetical protein